MHLKIHFDRDIEKSSFVLAQEKVNGQTVLLSKEILLVQDFS